MENFPFFRLLSLAMTPLNILLLFTFFILMTHEMYYSREIFHRHQFIFSSSFVFMMEIHFDHYSICSFLQDILLEFKKRILFETVKNIPKIKKLLTKAYNFRQFF